jgi:formylglycine-generating enzyme required for sulfatase activity
MDSNPSSFKGDDRPVERVSWNDVQEFIRRLNAQSRGVTFRLPTEAEWEYACRAGGKAMTYGSPSGQLASNLAKYGSNDGTVPVDSYPPNALGLHGMTGNVLEWTQDVYDAKAYRSGAVTNPVNERSGAYRVSRGGGWESNPTRNVRCSTRNGFDSGVRYDDFGFRLASTE